tara:strand:- start:298 stop:543 length:246 start_codon:yes stop_codon:yes gene_type:complete
MNKQVINQYVLVAAEVLGGKKALAKAIGVTPQFVGQLACGARPVPPRHCIPIEVASNMAVSRYDLRPDVFGENPKNSEAAA